jgi:hydrogenase-4 component E
LRKLIAENWHNAGVWLVKLLLCREQAEEERRGWMNGGWEAEITHTPALLMGLAGLAMLAQSQVRGLIRALAAQGWLLAGMLAWQSYVHDSPAWLVAAALAASFNGVWMPLWLSNLAQRLSAPETVPSAIGFRGSILLGLGAVGLAIVALRGPVYSSSLPAGFDFALAVSIIAMGFFVLTSRRHGPAQAAGFVAAQNGLILTLIGLPGGLPALLLQAALSALSALMAAGIAFFQISGRLDVADHITFEQWLASRRAERQSSAQAPPAS